MRSRLQKLFTSGPLGRLRSALPSSDQFVTTSIAIGGTVLLSVVRLGFSALELSLFFGIVLVTILAATGITWVWRH